MFRSNCDGFWSPKSAVDRSCCNFDDSESDVRRIKASFRVVYGTVGGGESSMSRTSTAYSFVSEAMTCVNFVVSSVMRHNLNWASAWANQTSESPGQDAGSLMATAETFSAGELVRCRRRTDQVWKGEGGGDPERVRLASGCARRWLGSTAGDGCG